VTVSPHQDDVSLREHLLAIMNEREKSVAQALAAATIATDKAEQNAERWRQSANEWRAAMDDRERKFVQVDVFTEAVRGLRAELAIAIEYINQNKGKGIGINAGWLYLIGGISAIGAIVTVITGIIILTRP